MRFLDLPIAKQKMAISKKRLQLVKTNSGPTALIKKTVKDVFAQHGLYKPSKLEVFEHLVTFGPGLGEVRVTPMGLISISRQSLVKIPSWLRALDAEGGVSVFVINPEKGDASHKNLDIEILCHSSLSREKMEELVSVHEKLRDLLSQAVLSAQNKAQLQAISIMSDDRIIAMIEQEGGLAELVA